MSEEVVLLSILGTKLRVFVAENDRLRCHQPVEALFRIIDKYEYCPEDLSDTDNQVIWTAITLLAAEYGVTPQEFESELGIGPAELDMWIEGVCMPLHSGKRKDIYTRMVNMLRRAHGYS